MGSISITPTTYGIKSGCKPHILLYQKSIRLFVDGPLALRSFAERFLRGGGDSGFLP